MIRNYSNFLDINKYDILNEGYSSNPQIIYWDSQFEIIKNNNWTEISTNRYNYDKYTITFKTGDDKYDYYSIIVDKTNNVEEYYLEKPKPVIEKIKNEFWKLPHIYIKNMKYKPKILGDLSHIEDGEKYNL